MDPNAATINPLFSFVPMIIMSLPMGLIAHFLAKEKGRNVTLWTILGIIPLVNFFIMWFFVGAANLKLERKLDALIERNEGHG